MFGFAESPSIFRIIPSRNTINHRSMSSSSFTAATATLTVGRLGGLYYSARIYQEDSEHGARRFAGVAGAMGRGSRNSARIDPYHRLDFSATITPRPFSKKKFTSTWVISIYNVYNRKNTFFIYYDTETNSETGSAKATAYKVSLFPIIPSITWNFKWNQKAKPQVKDF